MKKHFGILVCFLLAMPVLMHSQTAQKIEDLLSLNAVSNQQAAWLVLEAADVSGVAGILSEEAAFRYASDQQWLPRNIEPNDKARLDAISLLIMRSFDMKGGFLYGLTKNPHYAYRELVYRNVIVRRADPQMAVSGYWLLFMVNRVLSYQEADVL